MAILLCLGTVHFCCLPQTDIQTMSSAFRLKMLDIIECQLTEELVKGQLLSAVAGFDVRPKNGENIQ